jgi:hypothetical protein
MSGINVGKGKAVVARKRGVLWTQVRSISFRCFDV